MNASDIVKAKQNKTLYSAYYQPTVYSSTLYSTLAIYSSIGSTITDSEVVINTSYISCINTVYNYVDNPSFISYESLNQIKAGALECGAKSRSEFQLDRIPYVPLYTYKTVYSTFTIQNLILPSSVTIASSLISATPGPFIESFIHTKQGQSNCNGCNQCHNCKVAF